MMNLAEIMRSPKILLCGFALLRSKGSLSFKNHQVCSTPSRSNPGIFETFLG